jgi:hypothetical protein
MFTKRFCPECDEEIGFDYKTPDRSFIINEDGLLSRNDNNDAWSPNGDLPYVAFHCTNDMEHELPLTSEFNDWSREIEDYILSFVKEGKMTL